MTALETCEHIEKMVSIVPYQFEPESDDETVEVAGVGRFSVSRVNTFVVIIRCDGKLFTRTLADIMQITL